MAMVVRLHGRSRSKCSRILSEANNINSNRSLQGLMGLPEQLRDRIYELAAMGNIPVRARNRDFRVYSDGGMTSEISPATLCSEDDLVQSWEDWEGNKHQALNSQFCGVQLFAENLNVLSQQGVNEASLVLNDFLQLIGECFIFMFYNFLGSASLKGQPETLVSILEPSSCNI